MPEFTALDIRRIDAWLPENVDSRRRKLLPEILSDWAKVDISRYFTTEPAAVAQKRRQRLRRLAKIADHLLEGIDALDDRDRMTLAAQIGVAEGQELIKALFNEKNSTRVDETRNLIGILADGAKVPLWKIGRGQPRNISTHLVMMDIAAIFEWLTKTPYPPGRSKHTRRKWPIL